jgi:hypothetical protein
MATNTSTSNKSLRLTPTQHMHMRYANGCMHGDVKMDAANACAYLQVCYVFCNLQHVKKNLLAASHGVSACHREKCIPTWELPKCMPLSHTLQNGFWNTCSIGEGILAPLCIWACKIQMHAHMHGRLGSVLLVREASWLGRSFLDSSCDLSLLNNFSMLRVAKSVDSPKAVIFIPHTWSSRA